LQAHHSRMQTLIEKLSKEMFWPLKRPFQIIFLVNFGGHLTHILWVLWLQVKEPMWLTSGLIKWYQGKLLDAPPSSLIDSDVSLRWKQCKNKESGCTP
jgi:hypothetical protein